MLWGLIRLSFLLFLLRNVCSNQDDLPEIQTPLGRVKGFWKITINGRKHAAFEGIPYAKPPVGDLRFEEPQPITAWSGVWEANNPHTCLQAELLSSTPKKSIFGREDCLYLNIYVPAEFLLQSKNLDVIVSIHGGAFMGGSGHTLSESQVILDKDIIFVSINYRLGILGFLSTEDDVIPGNNGMKDQVLALEWIRDNIASFGGNPNSITITGISAGAASVHLHYFSPLSKGLFVRGISQSGTALAPWVVRNKALQKAKKLAVLVGCPDRPTKDLKTCLKQRPVENLLQQLKHFFGFAYMPFSPFSPVVEKRSKNAFLDKEPFQLLKESHVFDVPWITSITAEDGLLPAASFFEILDQIDQQWSQTSKYILDYNDTLLISKEETVAKQILEFYLGTGEKVNRHNFMKFTQMCTDRLFGIPAEVAAKMQSKANKSPVYFYIFNYTEGERSLVRHYSPSQDIKGVAHGDDGIYFYGIFSQGTFSEQDARMRNACQDVFYSFASKGKPSFDGTSTWQPTTSEELVYLNVTGPSNFRLQRTENLSPSDFWSKLGLLENDNVNIKDEL